jgi:DNA-binding CsgD family transcriptional regulator
VGDDITKAWSLSQLFLANLVAGTFETAIAHLTQAVDLLDHATRDIDRGWQAYILQGRGFFAKMQGDREEAFAFFREALHRARDVGTEAVAHTVLEEFAALVVEAGDVPRARSLAQEALEIAAGSMESWLIGFVLITMAYIDVLTGDVAHAAQLLGASDAVLEVSGTVFLMPLHRQRVAVIVDRAEAVLGLDGFAAQRAQGRAAPLAVIAEATRRAPSGTLAEVETPRLSRRESGVLQLVATGMTDREIAHALFISRKTASNHVANILRKLGVETRAAAAIYAVRAGLA